MTTTIAEDLWIFFTVVFSLIILKQKQEVRCEKIKLSRNQHSPKEYKSQTCNLRFEESGNIELMRGYRSRKDGPYRK